MVEVGEDNPLPVSQSTTGAPTDRSGTITTGATAQPLMAANGSRKGYLVYNSGAGDLWISDVGTAAATQPSIKIVAGAYYVADIVSTGAISIFGATTGQAFSAREW